MNRLYILIVIANLFTTSCVVASTSGNVPAETFQPVLLGTQAGNAAADADLLPKEEIVLPVSVYIIDDEGNDYSSSRTAEEIEEIYEKANQIWSQANIRLELEQVVRVEVPNQIAVALNAGQYRPFFQNINVEFDLPRSSLIYAFYTKEIGGPNGITPLGTRAFFVMDTPSVHDERVTSHEIGHILGLYHTIEDQDRLMYPGTNGMSLTEEEIIVARYMASGLVVGMR